MDKLCNSVDGSSIVLQRDFSENATLGSQNEIQSAHWNQRHATLFTAHAWVTDDTRENIVLITDNFDHTKVSIYTYNTGCP